MIQLPEMSDNCNVCLFTIGNDLFAGADTCMFRKVDSKTLECGDKFGKITFTHSIFILCIALLCRNTELAMQ